MSAALRDLLPRDKHDAERARALVDLGWPAVEPVMPEIMTWLQDANWPIARVFYPFLASIGKPLAPYVRAVFDTTDDIWKRGVLELVLRNSSELAVAFRADLERLVTAPTANEQAEDLDETAREILSSLT